MDRRSRYSDSDDDDDDAGRERRAERRAEEDGAMVDEYGWFNIKEYDLKTGKWKTGVNDTKRTNLCKSLIDSISLSKDPLTYARELYRSTAGNRDEQKIAKAKAKLIHRCLARTLKMSEDCDDEDLTIALAAMKVTDDDIIRKANSMAGGGALHQVGGAFGLDLAVALLLRMTNMPKMNAAVLDAVLKTPAAFNQILGWANGETVTGLTKMSDCLKSFLGIGAGQSYYGALTNQIAMIYYRGVTATEATGAAFKGKLNAWLTANPTDALGFTAIVMRYPGRIINITSATIRTLSSITVGTVEVAFAAASTIWSSDSGVLVCALLYFYEKYGDQFNNKIALMTDDVKAIFIQGINALGAIEEVINDKIDSTRINAQLGELRTRLRQFEEERNTGLLPQMTAQNLTLIAAVASKTSKLNFEAKQAEIDTVKIVALTGELNAALTALAGAKQTHTEALANRADAITGNLKDTGLAAASLNPTTVFGQPGATATGPMPPIGAMPVISATGAIPTKRPAGWSRAMDDMLVAGPVQVPVQVPVPVPGGKSRSRKSHKKVSKSKRPKKSVRSRKAKGAKRSNKKH